MRTVFDNCCLVRLTHFIAPWFKLQRFHLPNIKCSCLLEWKGSPSSPVSSLFSTDTLLICCRQEQFDTGDSLALLFNALCLRHKTGSFQTVVTLWGTFTHFPPGKAKTYFSMVSQKCWWVSEAWQAASEAGLPCRVFPCVLLGVAAQERREQGGQVSLTSNLPLSVRD